MDCSLSGSSGHGIFQARVLEWIAISSSRGSSRPRNRSQVSHIAGRCVTIWATREACGIFPDQGPNPYPLHWQVDSQPLDHQGIPLLHFRKVDFLIINFLTEVFFQHFEYGIPPSSEFHVFWKVTSLLKTPVSNESFFFLLCPISSFCLSVVWLWCVYPWLSLSLSYLVYLTSCICRLMFFIHLEHLDHYFFNILRP